MERDRVIYVCNDWPCASLPLWIRHYASEGFPIDSIPNRKRHPQIEPRGVWEKNQFFCHRWTGDSDRLEFSRDLCGEISEATTTLSTAMREEKENVLLDPNSIHLHRPFLQSGRYQASGPEKLSVAEREWRARQKQRISQARSVFLIHNAEFTGPDLSQSLIRLAVEADLSSFLPSKSVWLYQTFIPEGVLAGQANWLQTGLSMSNSVLTVSPGYAKELQAKFDDSPSGFYKDLKIKGIMNGLDTGTWNPSRDPMLSPSLHYTLHDLPRGKDRAKLHLQVISCS